MSFCFKIVTSIKKTITKKTLQNYFLGLDGIAQRTRTYLIKTSISIELTTLIPLWETTDLNTKPLFSLDSFNISDLPDLQILSFINLFTSFLLLAIIWLVLTPILDGTVTIVRNDNINDANHYDSNSLLIEDRSAYMTNFDSEEESQTYGQDYLYNDGSQYAQTYYTEPEAHGQYQNGWDFASRAFPNIWARMSRTLEG